MNNAFAEYYSKIDFFKGLIIYIILAVCILSPKSILLKITSNQQVITNIDFVVYSSLFLVTIICFFHTFKINRSIFNESNLKCTIICFFCIVALMVISAILLEKFHIKNNNESALENSSKTGYYFLFIISAIILGPFVEEMVYRFCFFRGLAQYNELLAHLIVALIFGFMHCGNAYFKSFDYHELSNMIPYFFMSLGLSIAYTKTGNIIFPIMIHSAINSMAAFK